MNQSPEIFRLYWEFNQKPPERLRNWGMIWFIKIHTCTYRLPEPTPTGAQRRRSWGAGRKVLYCDFARKARRIFFGIFLTFAPPPPPQIRKMDRRRCRRYRYRRIRRYTTYAQYPSHEPPPPPPPHLEKNMNPISGNLLPFFCSNIYFFFYFPSFLGKSSREATAPHISTFPERKWGYARGPFSIRGGGGRVPELSKETRIN